MASEELVTRGTGVVHEKFSNLLLKLRNGFIRLPELFDDFYHTKVPEITFLGNIAFMSQLFPLNVCIIISECL
jgi:hypothetical protein